LHLKTAELCRLRHNTAAVVFRVDVAPGTDGTSNFVVVVAVGGATDVTGVVENSA